METLIILVLLIVLIVVQSRFNTIKTLIEQQGTEMAKLRGELIHLRQGWPGTPSASPEYQPPVIANEPVPAPLSVPLVTPPPMPVRPVPVTAEPALEPVATFAMAATPLATGQPIAAPPTTRPPLVYVEPRPSIFRRFLTENPDLEKFIGENLINKVGIAILVAGIGYFVKFAIDQQWINEAGRVLVGILAGGLLLGLAHRTRRTFGAFSSVLVAGGLSVLYFTIAIAFSEYKLFSQTAAFGIMVVITGFAVLLAIAYNRVELAVMSLIGGFATPFMVSTGQSNYMVLFSYVLILDVGMLVLAYFKKWTLVHWVAYGFTVLLYGSWLALDLLENRPDAPYTGGLLFATLFYGVFMAMNLVYNLKKQLTFSAAEITLLLSNTAFYYAAGMSILDNVSGGAYQGLFTGLLAVLNFGYAAFLFRRQAIDRTLVYLLIGLVITFASLTGPVQLDGNFITMFWALEAVLLLWLAQRSGLRLIATGSVVVLGLMLISLTMDWSNLYSLVEEPVLPVIFNQAFVTGVVALAGLLATYRLLAQQTEPFMFRVGQLDAAVYRRLIGYTAVVTGYLAGALEVDYQLVAAYDFGPNRTILTGTYNLLFAVGLLLAVQSYRTAASTTRRQLWQVAALGLLALLSYLMDYSQVVTDLLLDYYRGTEASLVGFPFHYLSLALAVGLLVLLSRYKTWLAPLPAFISGGWPWFLGIAIVYMASQELFTHVIAVSFSDADIARQPAQQRMVTNRFDALLTQANKVGLPILWGVCAFAFMYIGLIRRNRTFRILSLSLFALTLAKLFLYDIQGISEGGRIAAFISLGVLLLIISFLYQKIKTLILVSDTTPSAPES
ncbi:MAG: DUF2339 domain-containing protein [Bacteroidetes bacterium]|nr:DUF2339 domain-containing protein [Fibrella sp.]